MKKIILITFLLIAKVILFAQNHKELTDTRPLNSVNVNLLGDASMISVNYERQFLVSPAFILTSKIGLGYNEEFQICVFGPCPPPDTYFIIPHHITGNLGKGKHLLEFGLGGTIINGNTTCNRCSPQPYLLYPIVGYRILPLKSDKFNFRIFGQIPLNANWDGGSVTSSGIFFSPFGLNFGISF